MPLLSIDEPLRFDLPAAGEWVKLKRRLSRGDEVSLIASYLRHRIGWVDEDGTVKLMDGVRFEDGIVRATDAFDAAELLEVLEFGVAERAIVAWSFDAPITPEAVRWLDPASIRAIRQRCSELYPAAGSDVGAFALEAIRESRLEWRVQAAQRGQRASEETDGG